MSLRRGDTLWTDDMVRKLLAMKAEGKPHADIALALGVTENSICGKVTRLRRSEPGAQLPEPRAVANPKPRNTPGWEERLMEPWAVYSLRKREERRLAKLKAEQPCWHNVKPVSKAVERETLTEFARISAYPNKRASA